MFRISLLALTLACCIAPSAMAVPTIAINNDVYLSSKGPAVTVPIWISDDGQGTPIPGAPAGEIGVIELNLSIDFGGPIITNIDLIGPGTIFNANNVGQSDGGFPNTTPGYQPSEFTQTITTTSFVSANGILAYVTFDPTGVPKGGYAFSFTNELGPTDVGNADVLPFLVNATIWVDAPEPASIIMGLMGAAALGAVVIRKRRARG